MGCHPRGILRLLRRVSILKLKILNLERPNPMFTHQDSKMLFPKIYLIKSVELPLNQSQGYPSRKNTRLLKPYISPWTRLTGNLMGKATFDGITI